MTKMIEIHCRNNEIKKEYLLGTSLFQIIKDQNIKLKYEILGARVNNEIEELSYEIFKPKIVKFIDITDKDGMRMYIRALSFILIRAVKELYPEVIIKIEHSISKGFYCELENFNQKLTDITVKKIRLQMQSLVDKNIPFIKKMVEVTDAIKVFEENKFYEKVKLFSLCPEYYTSLYYLGEYVDYFYGYLVPSTGYIKVFDLVKYQEGMLLKIPKQSNPEITEDEIQQPKLYEILREYKRWANIMNVATIGSLNECVMNKSESELIKIGEALHEKKVAKIADIIVERKPSVKIILIAGPSASGKTTFSKRLAIQLKVLGKQPVQLYLDNYFVNRVDTPRDEKGEYDFEALEAVDVQLFNDNYLDLIAGKRVPIPKFSFEKGQRVYDGEILTLSDDNILIVEGIHALNPKLTSMIKPSDKYKIYISALTQLGIDGHNRIPTTDNRLFRRMIRDNKYRGYSALETLRRWPSVRQGEEKYIFPFQEQADIMFNSALIYELGVLKKYVEPLLKEVIPIVHEYSEAKRLLKFLSYFRPIKTDEIPPTSILREFLYGSTFHY